MRLRDLWTPTYSRPEERWSRFVWGEITRGWTPPRITINGWHDNHGTLCLGLLLFCLYINLPKIKHLCGQGIDGGSYGFYFYDDALVLCWKKKNIFLYYPWSWSFHKHWVIVPCYTNDVEWLEVPHRCSGRDFAKKWEYPFRYTLKNGTIQDRTATIFVERREWRWRWLKLLPWPRKRYTAIDVVFNDEVGERTGTWKGGVTGCSYEMIKGEMPLQTLRRMERERDF